MKTLVIASVVAFVAGITFLGCFGEQDETWPANELRETERLGLQIVKAVELYYHQKGNYPTELAELQPTYLAQVTPPLVGNRRWNYRVHNGPPGSHFTLSVSDDTPDGRYRYYDLRSKQWKDYNKGS